MEKKPTIYDIARDLGVSVATVNRALNNKPGISKATRACVIDAATRLGFTVNRAAKSLGRPPIRLDFLVHNAVPVFMDEIIRGVRYGLTELQDFNTIGQIHEFKGDPFEVHQQYIDKLNELSQQRVDGLLLLPPSFTSSFYNCTQKLDAAKTRFAFVSTDVPGTHRLFACCKNAALAGRMAAELLYWMIPSDAAHPHNVAIFTGQKDANDHENSISGFQEECICRGMNIVSVCENYDDPDFAAYKTEHLFKAHPEINGIYINTANSIAVCQKLQEMDLAHSVRIVASDIFPELVNMMHDGIIQATIFQDPFRQGLQAIKSLYRCIAEGETAPSDILIRPQIVLQSNLSDFLHEQN